MLLFCCCVVLLFSVVVVCVVVCCCAQPLKTLNLAWESGPALRGPTCSGFGVVVVVVVVVAGLDFPGPASAGPPPPLDPPSAGPPKFSLFFFPFPPPFRSFCVSLGVFSWNFGGVLKRKCPEMCTFGLSGCRVKPRRPHQTGRRGSHTTARELQTCTFQGTCASKHHQNSTRRPPERHRNSETEAGKGRKSAKFWASHPSGPHPFGAPPFRGPTLSGPHPFGAPPFRGPTLRGSTFSRFGPPTHRGSTLRGSTLRGGAQKGGTPMGKTLKH